MRVRREDPVGLGFSLNCFSYDAISSNELSNWAARAIDDESDPPLYLYDLLDFRGYLKDLDRLFGFTPNSGLHENDWQYLVQIGARRGRPPHTDIAYAMKYKIPARRKEEIDRRFLDMFGIDVSSLPR